MKKQEKIRVYLGQDEGGYIGIPWGLREELIERCERGGIAWEEEDAEDNLMRVCSGKIAEELLEITFGRDESPEPW